MKFEGRRSTFEVLVAVAAFVLTCAHAAAAQTPPNGPSSSGPLVFEPIKTEFVVAPEYKFTELDGQAGHLAGVTAGALTDKSMFLGGAVYTLTNRSDDFGLTYGGLLFGWTVPVGSAVRVGGRGLAGFGRATLGNAVTVRDRRSLDLRTVRFVGEDDFALFEPQAQVNLRLAQKITLDGTAGYRLTGWDDVLWDRLDGVTGSLGVQIAW